MAFIRKVRTASGAIAVQIAHKKHGRITRIEHIGSAHSEAELGTLLSPPSQVSSAGRGMGKKFCKSGEFLLAKTVA